MLLKFKKSTAYNFIVNSEHLANYNKGSYEKINPNNKSIYSYLNKSLNSVIKNAYNIYDKHSETVGIICTSICDKNNIGGLKLLFIGLGEDGYYDVESPKTIFDGTFEYLEDTNENTITPYWKSKNLKELSHISTILPISTYTSKTGEVHNILSSITNKQAAHKIIFRLSKLFEAIYNEDLKITSKYNKNIL